MADKNMAKFIVLALIAEILLIYSSVLVKIIPVSPIILAFYRVTIAIPIFFLLAFRTADFWQISLRDFWIMLLAGFFFALDLIFFNTALHKTSVAHVNLIGSLVCFVLAPIGAIFFHEKIKKEFVFGCILAIFGVFLLLQGRIEGSVSTLFGNFLALLCMIFYSFFLALVFLLRKKYSALTVMAFSSIGASLMLLATGVLVEGFSVPTGISQWLYVLLIVLFGQILGQGFFSYIMGKISTQASSLLLLVSPIIAAIMGFFILNERLGLVEIGAIGVILVGVYFAQQKSNISRARKKILKRRKKAHSPLAEPTDAIRPL